MQPPCLRAGWRLGVPGAPLGPRASGHTGNKAVKAAARGAAAPGSTVVRAPSPPAAASGRGTAGTSVMSNSRGEHRAMAETVQLQLVAVPAVPTRCRPTASQGPAPPPASPTAPPATSLCLGGLATGRCDVEQYDTDTVWSDRLQLLLAATKTKGKCLQWRPCLPQCACLHPHAPPASAGARGGHPAPPPAAQPADVWRAQPAGAVGV